MSRREITRTIDLTMRTWGPRVTEVALGFEARWTRRALRNFDPKLADAFEERVDAFDRAMDSGTSTEIETEGGRLCRAYGVIAAKMAAANVPDDAYLIGRHGGGTADAVVIAISNVPATRERVRELLGEGVTWFSADELATLVALDARAKKIADIKRAFPGAEIMNITDKGEIDDAADQA